MKIHRNLRRLENKIKKYPNMNLINTKASHTLSWFKFDRLPAFIFALITCSPKIIIKEDYGEQVIYSFIENGTIFCIELDKETGKIII